MSYVSSPPLLVSPKSGETFFLYLVASDETLVAVLIKETPSDQLLIYYVSEAVLNLNYSRIEKLVIFFMYGISQAKVVLPKVSCYGPDRPTT